MIGRRTIHLVDDDDAVRRSVGFLLKTAGFAVKSYASGVEFLKEAAGAEPGCILLDLRMPDMNGLEVQRALGERGIGFPVIVLTGHGDVGVAVEAMKMGAVDFLEKPFDRAALLGAIEAGFERLDNRDINSSSRREAQVRLAVLTPRERDVLRGLAVGLPNKSIAHKLGISIRTVEVHRANLMTRLDATNLSEVLRLAFIAGIADD